MGTKKPSKELYATGAVCSFIVETWNVDRYDERRCNLPAKFLTTSRHPGGDFEFFRCKEHVQRDRVDSVVEVLSEHPNDSQMPETELLDFEVSRVIDLIVEWRDQVRAGDYGTPLNNLVALAGTVDDEYIRRARRFIAPLSD